MFKHLRSGVGHRSRRLSPAVRRLVAGFVLALGLAPCALAIGTTSAGAATSYLTITNANLPPATAGFSYSQQLEVSGGTGPYVFQFEGPYSPPPGLTMSSSGLISYEYDSSTQFNEQEFLVGVTDPSTGARTQFDWEIVLPVLPSYASAEYIANPSLQVPAGEPFSQQLAIAGGTGPYSFAFSRGSLPSGLTVSPSGLVSGTASAQGDEPVTNQVFLNVTDEGNGEVFGSEVDMDVTPPDFAPPPPPSLAPTSLPEAKTGKQYTQTITPSGGTSPYQVFIASGALPSGFQLEKGTITGESASPESSTFVVEVVDSGYSTPGPDQLVYMEQSSTQTYTLTVTSGVTGLDPILGSLGQLVTEVTSLFSGLQADVATLEYEISCLPDALDTLFNGVPPGCP